MKKNDYEGVPFDSYNFNVGLGSDVFAQQMGHPRNLYDAQVQRHGLAVTPTSVPIVVESAFDVNALRVDAFFNSDLKDRMEDAKRQINEAVQTAATDSGTGAYDPRRIPVPLSMVKEGLEELIKNWKKTKDMLARSGDVHCIPSSIREGVRRMRDEGLNPEVTDLLTQFLHGVSSISSMCKTRLTLAQKGCNPRELRAMNIPVDQQRALTALTEENVADLKLSLKVDEDALRQLALLPVSSLGVSGLLTAAAPESVQEPTAASVAIEPAAGTTPVAADAGTGPVNLDMTEQSPSSVAAPNTVVPGSKRSPKLSELAKEFAEQRGGDATLYQQFFRYVQSQRGRQQSQK